MGSVFRFVISASGFRGEGLEFGVDCSESGFRVQGSVGMRACGLGLRVGEMGFKVGVVGVRVQG